MQNEIKNEADIDKKLTQIAAEDRAALLTEKDVEFLKSIGVGIESRRNVDEFRTTPSSHKL